MQATQVCSVEGCGRTDRIVRGMCGMHIKRWRKRGTAEPYTRSITSPAERLARRLVATEGGCHEWTGGTSSNGYGTINVNGKNMLTHRLAWTLANGPIPDGLLICHHCDNKICCNPQHLFLGTNADNNADMDAKGRRVNSNDAKTHCPADHEYTEANTWVDKRGKRYCRTCQRAQDAACRLRRAQSA